MPKSRSVAVRTCSRLIVMFCTGACTLSFARAEDLYLEVFINGEPTGMIGAFRKSEDGGLSVRPEELREVGIKPDRKATQADGTSRSSHSAERLQASTLRLRLKRR